MGKHSRKGGAGRETAEKKRPVSRSPPLRTPQSSRNLPSRIQVCPCRDTRSPVTWLVSVLSSDLCSNTFWETRPWSPLATHCMALFLSSSLHQLALSVHWCTPSPTTVPGTLLESSRHLQKKGILSHNGSCHTISENILVNDRKNLKRC